MNLNCYLKYNYLNIENLKHNSYAVKVFLFYGYPLCSMLNAQEKERVRDKNIYVCFALQVVVAIFIQLTNR